MQKQCQLAVLPLGTGNDLARVLGWGSSCDDDTHLHQLLEKYEKAGTKMLDRWSIMTFERTIAMHKVLTTKEDLKDPKTCTSVKQKIEEYENSVISDLQTILDSDEISQVLNSAKRLCESVKEVIAEISKTSSDNQFSTKCKVLNDKLDLLLHTLTTEENDSLQLKKHCEDRKRLEDLSNTEAGTLKDSKTEKNYQTMLKKLSRRESIDNHKGAIQKERLILRANSLKRAIRNLVDHAEKEVDDQNLLDPGDGKEKPKMDSLKVCSPSPLK